MIDGHDIREEERVRIEFEHEEAAGQKRVRQDRRVEERELWRDSPRHGEEGCTILVLMLRRIFLCDAARRWPSTVRRDCVRPYLEASCCVTGEEVGAILQGSGVGKNSAPFCRGAASAGAIVKSCCMWVSVPWCCVSPPKFLPVCFPPRERLGVIFGRVFPRSDDAVWRTSSSRNSPLGTQLSARRKGGFFFYLFCPLVCIKVCVEAPQIGIYFYLTFRFYYYTLNYYHCKCLIFFSLNPRFI